MLGRRRWYSIFGERKVIIWRMEWILQELNVRALQCSKHLDRAISHGVPSLLNTQQTYRFEIRVSQPGHSRTFGLFILNGYLLPNQVHYY